MNPYRETIPMKSTPRWVSVSGQDIYGQGTAPPPLYKSEVVLPNYLRNRVNLAAIAVFFCLQTLHPVAALWTVRVGFRLTYCKDNYLRNRISFATYSGFFLPARAPSGCCPAGCLCYILTDLLQGYVICKAKTPITVKFVDILETLRNTWKIEPQNTQTFLDNRRKPDFTVKEKGHSPIVAEVKIDGANHPDISGENQAKRHLGRRLASYEIVTAAMAVRFPYRFRDIPNRDLAEEIRRAKDLHYVLLDVKMMFFKAFAVSQMWGGFKAVSRILRLLSGSVLCQLPGSKRPPLT